MVKEKYPKPHPHDKRMSPGRKRFWSSQISRERKKAQEAFLYYDSLIDRLKKERELLLEMPWYARILFVFLGRGYAAKGSEIVPQGELADRKKIKEAWSALAGEPGPHHGIPVDVSYTLDGEGTVTLSSTSSLQKATRAPKASQ